LVSGLSAKGEKPKNKVAGLKKKGGGAKAEWGGTDLVASTQTGKKTPGHLLRRTGKRLSRKGNISSKKETKTRSTLLGSPRGAEQGEVPDAKC